jgi:putative oxidoreductase
MTAMTASTGARETGLLHRLMRTDDDLAALVMRLGLAIVIFPHGAQKALGWFGGPGVGGTLGFLGSMGVPSWLAALVIVAEFFGSIGLVIGLLGRVAAFGILCDMIGAVLLVHAKTGFFMNWSGKQAGEGFEYHILAIAIALAIMIRGSGAASVDRALTRR